MPNEEMTQSEARKAAKRINDNDEAPRGLVAIAVPVPFNSWGGHETGWTVTYTPVNRGEV